MPQAVLESFRHIERRPVEFRDIDMLNHVNHVTYIQWCETIRCSYLEQILGEDIRSERGIIMAKLECVYERPVPYPGHVAVGVRVARLGTKSFDFAYEVWDEDADARAFTALSTMVAFDYPANRSIAIPEVWRERIARFEGVPPAEAGTGRA